MSVERTSYNVVDAGGFTVANVSNWIDAQALRELMNNYGPSKPYSVENVYHATNN
jgi:hypothetical protein